MWKAFEGIRCGYQRGDTRNLEGACVWRAPVRASQTRPSCTGPWTLRHHCPRPPRPGCPDSPRMARPLAQPPPGRCCQPRGPRRQRQKEGAPPEGRVRWRGAQDVASMGAPRGGLSHGSGSWAPLSPSRRRLLGGSSSRPESPCGQRQGQVSCEVARNPAGMSSLPPSQPASLLCSPCSGLHLPPDKEIPALGCWLRSLGRGRQGGGVDLARLGVRGTEPRAP